MALEQTGQGVKCFEQSQGLDTTLYKKVPFLKDLPICVTKIFSKHGVIIEANLFWWILSWNNLVNIMC